MPSAQPPTREQDLEYGQSAAEVRRSLHFSTYFLGRSQKSHMPFIESIIAQRFGVEEVGSLSTACVLAIIITLVDWYRNGWSLHIALVLVGAISSIVTSFVLIIHCVKALPPDNGSPVTGLSMSIFTLIGFVPFFFALYLITFESVYMLVEHFSIGQLVQSLLFVAIGQWIAKRVRRLHEFQSCVYQQIS